VEGNVQGKYGPLSLVVSLCYNASGFGLVLGQAFFA
jgi:hypothetical protein